MCWFCECVRDACVGVHDASVGVHDPCISVLLFPIAPLGLRETLDGWLPPVSSAGQMFFK